VVWIFGSFIVSVLGNKYGWSKKLTGCLILTAGLETPLSLAPIIEANYTSRRNETAILVDQLGTFVVLSTLDFSGYHVFKRSQMVSRFLK
jgi:hypothetical protein